MGYNKYTFWQILKEKQIIIPIIQRDYAQGRDGQEYVRKSFLEQLGNAVFIKKQTELDFVYGTEKDKKIYPLDGQQRLTTLWLLHWYVAYKAKKTNCIAFSEDDKKKLKDSSVSISEFEESKQEIVKTVRTLKKFSYETRTSSREFCEKLCEMDYIDTCDIVTYITNQTWFFSAWKQDPTIQAMLKMLSGTNVKSKEGNDFIDGIEELFKDKTDLENYWSVLTQEECPITFNFLPLESNELPVSDDLYIKMNARGKALTSFENFKAHFIRWMKNSENPEYNEFQKTSTYDGREMPYYLAFSNKIDNEWTDIFWLNGKKPGRVDEIYFAFINRYFYNLVITKDGLKDDNAPQNTYYAYFSDIKNSKEYDKKIAYTSFDFYSHFLNVGVINDFSTIMNNLYSSTKKCKNLEEIFVCKWNKGFLFIPEFCQEGERWKKIDDNAGNKIYEVTTINQMERVVFYAICKYFKVGPITDDGTSLQRWMRFVWNLVSDYDNNNTPSIRSIGAMQAAISLIDKIQNPHDIYGELKNINVEPSKSGINCRFNEEIAKAKQILDKQRDTNIKGPNEEQRSKAENHAFFRGAIRFLFTDEKGNMNDWDNFDEKFKNTEKYFDDNGVTAAYRTDANLLRRLISHFNKTENFNEIYYDNTVTNWLTWILLNTKLTFAVNQLLLNDDSQTFDFCQYNSVNTNPEQQFLKNHLVKNTAVSLMVEGCELHYWNGTGYILYPHNVKAEWKKYVITPRIDVLFDMKKHNTISFIDQNQNKEEYIKSKLLWGKNIGFTYNKHSFVWQHWNWIDMYYEGKRLQDDPIFKDKCIIDGSQIVDSTDLIPKLNNCIREYERIKHESPII